ncbi:hypothetical protein NGK36_15510 [Hafnia alvei]|uniref:hypothetical protein n=1 Tax=Hafnia alvei TaxID=569 RepID=UPI002DBBC4D3|nr:hypothetical protein [Hafnia alvei]MEB7890683.1 hypothetical protein [Hafnia alvei]
MSNFFKKYIQIANDSSGAIALSAIQAFVMMAGLVKVNEITGGNHWVMWGVISFSTAGFFASCISVAVVIFSSENTNRWDKAIISLLFYPTYVGIMLSAFITAKAIL